MQVREALTYDDVLLEPKYSEIKSRSEVSLALYTTKGFHFKSPIVPANMHDIMGVEMASVMYEQGCLSLMHRFCSIDEQLNFFKILVEKYGNDIFNYVGCSIGVKDIDKENVAKFAAIGCKIICIDVAHGDSHQASTMTTYISRNYPDSLLISGNVATGEGARLLWCAGADLVKVGIGPGSICTTRLETGNGVPQLTALSDIYTIKEGRIDKLNKGIIADGGIKTSGDCVKALCFADMVMTGGLFAGTTETPGSLVLYNDTLLKKYGGSSTHKASRIEGCVTFTQPKGSAKIVLDRLHEGIQSGCAYQGAGTLFQLKKNPCFVKVSSVQHKLDSSKETTRV